MYIVPVLCGADWFGVCFSGVVGRSFTMIFISAGYNVHIYDTSKDQIDDALQDIHGQLTKLQSIGLLRGKLSAEEQFKLIEVALSLSHCVEGAVYIQVSILTQPYNAFNHGHAKMFGFGMQMDYGLSGTNAENI